jgi:beta-glucosidase
MCSYNDENNIPTCGNDEILNRDLRKIMGFKGYVMSDWDATYSGPKDYVKNGLDQE